MTPSDLGTDKVTDDLLELVRRRVQANRNIIVRQIKVDRTRTPQQALAATGRRQYVDGNVVATMPGRGEGEEVVAVYFFKPELPEGQISDSDLEEEYHKRGLIPADAYSVAKVNQEDPSFSDNRPNATHWQAGNGNWHSAAFRRWHDEPGVFVDRYVLVWGARWWFAGVRQVQPLGS